MKQNRQYIINFFIFALFCLAVAANAPRLLDAALSKKPPPKQQYTAQPLHDTVLSQQPPSTPALADTMDAHTDALVKYFASKAPHIPRHEIHDIIKSVKRNCTLYNVPEALVLAIIYHESNFDRFAIGKHGEVGLMQIRPRIWLTRLRKASVIKQERDLFNVNDNIKAGIFIYTELLKQKKSIVNALCAYNGDKAFTYAHAVLTFAVMMSHETGRNRQGYTILG